MLLHNQYEFNPETDLIAKGGFAEVFKAYDKNLDMTVAIKRYSTDGGKAGSVIKEIRKSIGFSHPNIIRYYNCFNDSFKDRMGREMVEEYGVMEYANAGNFADIIEGKRKLSIQQFRAIVDGILSGLHYLHARQPVVIHRDLKPSNILLHEENGQLIPKICDFGISKELSGHTSTSTATGILGTIEYMAPEQLDMARFGENGQLQPSADLWALGCMLFEYFTGQAPFGKQSKRNSPAEIMNKILYHEPDPTLIQKIPEEYRAMVIGYLKKHAVERGQFKRTSHSQKAKRVSAPNQQWEKTTEKFRDLAKEHLRKKEEQLEGARKLSVDKRTESSDNEISSKSSGDAKETTEMSQSIGKENFSEKGSRQHIINTPSKIDRKKEPSNPFAGDGAESLIFTMIFVCVVLFGAVILATILSNVVD
jgi:serine/threonine protein kinase